MIWNSNIVHPARKKLSLTVNEYCLADLVYHLSNNPGARIKGWCTASKPDIAETFDLSKRSIINLTNKLIDKGILTKHKNGRYLKTTQIWYDTIVLYSKEGGEESSPLLKKQRKKRVKKVHPKGEESSPLKVKKVHHKGEESSPNINNSNINSNSDRGENPPLKKINSNPEIKDNPLKDQQPKEPVAEFQKEKIPKKEKGFADPVADENFTWLCETLEMTGRADVELLGRYLTDGSVTDEDWPKIRAHLPDYMKSQNVFKVKWYFIDREWAGVKINNNSNGKSRIESKVQATINTRRRLGALASRLAGQSGV